MGGGEEERQRETEKKEGRKGTQSKRGYQSLAAKEVPESSRGHPDPGKRGPCMGDTQGTGRGQPGEQLLALQRAGRVVGQAKAGKMG